MHCRQESEQLDSFLKSSYDGFYYLSHASILVRLSGTTILFDPVLAEPPHFGSWLFYPPMHFSELLSEVDYCIVSHQHKDHYDPNFLRLLSQNTQILIVSGRPHFEDLFRQENITFSLMPSHKLFNLEGDIYVYCANHESNGIDSAICIRNNNLSVYHGNDCYLSSEVTLRIREGFGPVDIACVPFAYIHWYPFLVNNMTTKEKEVESDRLVSSYMKLALDQIRCLNPSIAIPFGANMFYNDGVDTDHNKCVLNPIDFKDFADQHATDISSSVMPLFAGAIIRPDNCNEQTSLKVSGGLLSREKLLDGFASYLSEVNNNKEFVSPLLNAYPLSNSEIISIISARLAKSLVDNLPTLNHSIYISSSCSPTIIEIPLDGSDPRIVTSILSNDSPYHHFILTTTAFNAFCSGQFSLGELVAASMFTLTREPNTYSQDVLKYVNSYI